MGVRRPGGISIIETGRHALDSFRQLLELGCVFGLDALGVLDRVFRRRVLTLQKLKPLFADACAQANAVLDGVAALVLVAGHALLVRVVLVEAQRRLGADRPVVAGVPRARVVPAAADARQRRIARPNVPVEHGLGIG